MELQMMIAGGFLGIGFLILSFKENKKMLLLADFLAALFMVLLFLATGEKDGIEIAGLAVLSLSLMFLSSKIKLFQSSRFAKLIMVVPSLLFYFFGGSFNYGDYPVEHNSLNFHLLLAYGILVPLVMDLKTALFSSVIGVKDDSLKLPLRLFIIGFAAFFGTFLLSWAGLFLIGLGLAIYSLFSQGKGRELMYALFAVLLSGFFIDFGGLEIVDLSMGKVIEGLFFGVFAVTFVGAVNEATKMRVLWTVLSLLLSMFIISGVVLLGTQKSDLGGMDAYIGVLIGASIAFVISGNRSLSGVFFGFLTFLGLWLFPYMKIPVEQSGQLSSGDSGVTKTETITPEVIETIKADSLTGLYEVSKDGFKFDFELGPKGGRTKGAFKDITGEVRIADQIQNSSFNIEMPITGLTTFNSFRDESLMEAEYFNAANFSSVQFKSNKMDQKNDGYLLKGKFTMLGVTKDQEVFVRFVKEENGRTILHGEGSVDRTLYGMRPDPKEGNVVDFKFKLDLHKKN